MPRYAILIEYDGRPFSGWQSQETVPSVQAALERAVTRVTGEDAPVQGAGRTDAGVHARGQVGHVDLSKAWSPFRLSEALNYHLKPEPVAVLAAAEVAADWHARFSAVERRYLYRILRRRAPVTLEAGQVWRIGHELDVAAMEAGAAHLIGHHDFTTFRSSMCQAASPMKTLDDVGVSEVQGPAGPEIHLKFRARSFLHNQVRSFVGSLERVGSGRWEPADMGRALAARDRARCGHVAPPDGLTLMTVRYPDDVFG